MINPLGIILLCQTAPIMKAPTKDYAIAEIIPGARYHIEFADSDYYIAVSDEMHKVFDREYYGVAMAIRSKDDIRNENVELHEIYARGKAFIIDNHDCGCLDVYGKDSGAFWLVNNEGSIWCQFHDKYRWLEEKDPKEFNAMWQEYVDSKIGLDVDHGKIVF